MLQERKLMKTPEGYKLIRWNSEFTYKNGEYMQIASCVPTRLLNEFCDEHCLYKKMSEDIEDDDE
jgi:hypothetical protein